MVRHIRDSHSGLEHLKFGLVDQHRFINHILLNACTDELETLEIHHRGLFYFSMTHALKLLHYQTLTSVKSEDPNLDPETQLDLLLLGPRLLHFKAIIVLNYRTFAATGSCLQALAEHFHKTWACARLQTLSIEPTWLKNVPHPHEDSEDAAFSKQEVLCTKVSDVSLMTSTWRICVPKSG